jgi:DNA-binding HxlR family transcriptional regulator
LKTYNQQCNIATALDILGDRWTLLIVRDILFGKKTFSELKESLKGIPPNLLSDRLQHLEKCGIVQSNIYSHHPPRYEYTLTEKGMDLRVVLDALCSWGAKHTEPKYTELIHEKCGHELTLTLYCPHCEENVETAVRRRMD